MDLVHRFSVQAPIKEAWYALNHIDRLAPCFPGARIDSFVGDEFTGSVKIKFGPTLDYKGSGKFLERDDAEHKAVVEARGSDLRGGSGVLAKVYVAMWENGRLTDVEVKTDLGISGRPAQLGRGVIEDVSNKLMLAFVDRLQVRFDAGIGRPDYVAPAPAPATAQPAPEAQPAAETAAASQAAPAPAATGAAAAVPRHRYPRTSPAAAGGPAVFGGAPNSSGPSAGTDAPKRAAVPNAPQYGTAFPEDEPALNVLTAVLPSVLKRYGLLLAAGAFVMWLTSRIIRKARGKS